MHRAGVGGMLPAIFPPGSLAITNQWYSQVWKGRHQRTRGLVFRCAALPHAVSVDACQGRAWDPSPYPTQQIPSCPSDSVCIMSTSARASSQLSVCHGKNCHCLLSSPHK